MFAVTGVLKSYASSLSNQRLKVKPGLVGLVGGVAFAFFTTVCEETSVPPSLSKLTVNSSGATTVH